MRLIVADDYSALSRTAADIIESTIRSKPDATIVPATGDTPMGAYRELAARHEAGTLDASRLRIFQLDEYLGVPPDDPRSLYGWMVRSLVQPLAIPDSNVVRLPCDEQEAVDGCARYEQSAGAMGPFDLVILGLGPNGHLGFNEPPCGADTPTRPVDLTEESIKSNARYWGSTEMVPRRAVTVGMTHLLAARRVLLLVSGAHKRDILERTINGPVTPQVPSSYLQQPPDVTILADRAAWPHPHLPVR